MRKLKPYFSLHDVPLDLVVDGEGTPWSKEGLCCPDDPLDDIVSYLSVLDDAFLEALEADCCSTSPSPSPPRGVVPASQAPAAGGRYVEDVDATGAAENTDMDSLGAGAGFGMAGSGVFQVIPRDALSTSVSATSTTAPPSGCSPSPTSGKRESQTAASPLQATVRKRRNQLATVRRRVWTMVSPSLNIPPVAIHEDSSHGDDINGGGFSSCDYNGGGGGNSRPAKRGRHHYPNKGKKACFHCHTSETPQWRKGPDGPSTLCNACGIRYNMDRLLPEYRPSTSPNFRSNEHSNRHKNVVKLNEKKSLGKLMPAMTRDGGRVTRLRSAVHGSINPCYGQMTLD